MLTHSKPQSANSFSKSSFHPQPGLMLLPQPLHLLSSSNASPKFSKRSRQRSSKNHPPSNTRSPKSKQSSPSQKIDSDDMIVNLEGFVPTAIEVAFPIADNSLDLEDFNEVDLYSDEKDIKIFSQKSHITPKRSSKRRPKLDLIESNRSPVKSVGEAPKEPISGEVDQISNDKEEKEKMKKGGGGKRKGNRPNKLQLEKTQASFLQASTVEAVNSDAPSADKDSSTNILPEEPRPVTPISSTIPPNASAFDLLTPVNSSSGIYSTPVNNNRNGIQSLPSTPGFSSTGKPLKFELNPVGTDDSAANSEVKRKNKGGRRKAEAKRKNATNMGTPDLVEELVKKPSPSEEKALLAEDQEELTSLATIFSSSLPLQSSFSNHHRSRTAPQQMDRRNRNRSSSQLEPSQRSVKNERKAGGNVQDSSRSPEKPKSSDIKKTTSGFIEIPFSFGTSSSSANESSSDDDDLSNVHARFIPLPESPVRGLSSSTSTSPVSKADKPKISRSNTLPPNKKKPFKETKPQHAASTPSLSQSPSSGSGLTWQQQMLSGSRTNTNNTANGSVSKNVKGLDLAEGPDNKKGGKKQRSAGNLKKGTNNNNLSKSLGVQGGKDLVNSQPAFEDQWDMDGIEAGVINSAVFPSFHTSGGMFVNSESRPLHRRNQSVGPGIALSGFEAENSGKIASFKFSQYAGPKFHNSPEPSGLPKPKGTWDGSQFV